MVASIAEAIIMPGTAHIPLRPHLREVREEKAKVSLVERQVGREKVKAKEKGYQK